MHFTAEGEISRKELITDRKSVASYCTLRDLAIENSTAETIAA
jgi:hypothetical protein